MKFIRVNEKRYDVKEIKDELFKIYNWVHSFYNEDFQNALVNDLILRNLAYVIGSEFFKENNIIDNKLDLVNVYVPVDELFIHGEKLSNDSIVVSLGLYRDVDVNGEIKTKIVFGRC